MTFSGAMTPVPSDSFPGLVAQLTGGNPGTTGLYYDDSYDHALLPAGTTDCATPGPAPRSTTPRTWTGTRPPWTPDRACPACPAPSWP